MRAKPISRIDIAAALVTLLLLASLVFAQTVDARELSNRATCAANLRGIMQSIVVYSADNNDVYPALTLPASATTYDVTFKGATITGLDGDKALAAMNKDAALLNNPSAALWLLVIDGQVAAKQFICRSDLDSAPGAMTNPQGNMFLNFPSAGTFSYSSAYPWTQKNGKVVLADLWKNSMDAGAPILSDMAPYFGRTVEDFKDPAPVAPTPEGRAITDRLIRDLTSPEYATREAASRELTTKGADAFPGLAQAVAASSDPELHARTLRFLGSSSRTQQWLVTKANSTNHSLDGQNLAFGDAHAEFSRTPAAGENAESIWGIIKDPANGTLEVPIAAGNLPRPVTGTLGSFDSVMVPTRDARGNLK